MDIQIVANRLLKVAQNLESKSYHSSAARVRAVIAEIGKFLPQYQTEESEKEMLIADIKRRIPGAAIKAQLNSAQDAAYYDIEFRNGTRIYVSQTLGGPFRTLSKETENKPFGVSLVQTDEWGREKLIPSGISKSREELIPYLQKIAIGSEKEVTEISKERRIKCAFIDIQPK